MNIQETAYFLFGLTLVVMLIVLIFFYYSKKRHRKIEEPKYTMLDDDG